MRCQSVMQPLAAEYWHIGAMTIRLGNSTAPTRSGVNSTLMPTSPYSSKRARPGGRRRTAGGARHGDPGLGVVGAEAADRADEDGAAPRLPEDLHAGVDLARTDQ